MLRFRLRGTGYLLLAALAASVAGQAGWAQTLLVEGGQPRATIVIPADAAKDEALAAGELQSHLLQMSGATLAIVTDADEAGGVNIFIGAAAPESGLAAIRAGGTDPASFRLLVTPDAIHVTGLSPQGTLIGVYELLEQLGVRWFMPGEIGTIVPRMQTVAVRNQDTIQHAGFVGRVLQHIDDTQMDPPQRLSAGKWLRRMRTGGPGWGRHGFGISLDAKTEPELFLHINGRPSYVKVSHPEVLRRVVARCRAELKQNPKIRYISMGPTDAGQFGHSPWDANDPDPLHGEPSVTDRYVKFFNLILDNLQQDYPDVGIAYYCYSLHMRPPVREKPNAHILPVFAPIDVCRFHSIDDPICNERAYIRQIVDGWQALGVQMAYRGYLFNLADPGLPFAMLRQVRSELPYYHRSGMIASRIECKPAWGYQAPALYLAGKLMWDPTLDAEALLADYFTKLYGPAAQPMRDHFERLDRAYTEADYHTGNVIDTPHILTPEVMAELATSLAQAETAAPAGSVYAARVRMVRSGYEFGRAYLAMMAAIETFDFVEAKRLLDEIRQELLPAATAHDPPIINRRYGVGFTQRFWAAVVEQGYERVTGGNAIVARLPDEWLFTLDPLDGGEALGLWKPDAGTNSWLKLKTWSQSWSNQGLRYYKGVAWYRTSVAVPAEYAGRTIRLWLGGVDESARVWLNGKPLELIASGSAPIGVPWEFAAGDAVRFGGDNVIVVKVTNNALNELGTGGLTAPAMLWAEATK